MAGVEIGAPASLDKADGCWIDKHQLRQAGDFLELFWSLTSIVSCLPPSALRCLPQMVGICNDKIWVRGKADSLFARGRKRSEGDRVGYQLLFREPAMSRQLMEIMTTRTAFSFESLEDDKDEKKDEG